MCVLLMKPQKNNDRISQIMNDSDKVMAIIQSGINAALLRHKQAGNPVQFINALSCSLHHFAL